MAVAKTTKKPTTETPVFSINPRVTAEWGLLANEEAWKNRVIKVFAKRLAWVSTNVVANGKDLRELWPKATTYAREAGVDYISPREIKTLLSELESVVVHFIQSLEFADILGPPTTPYYYRDPITDVLEIAWEIIYDGGVYYLVVRVSDYGISTEVKRYFSGKKCTTFLHRCIE